MITQDLARALYGQMAGALFPYNIEGTCEIRLMDEKGPSSAYITYRNNELSYSEDPGTAADVAVSMKPETLSWILTAPDRFDLRNPEILMQVSAEGNLELANFLFSLVKRPSAEIEGLMRNTEKRNTEKSAAGKQATEVKRVHRPTEEEVIRLIAASEPFVITGALEGWPFLTGDFQQLKEESGDTPLQPDITKANGQFETLRDFIEKMENARDGLVYTFGIPLPLALWAEIPLPYFDWDSMTSPQIWMGRRTGEKPCTTLHRDCTHGLLNNLLGRKKMIFFSPDQSEHLYPIKAFNTYQPCEIGDVKAVDTDKFPLFEGATPIEVTVGPGEILVIPAFWYHCVYAVDDVFSISSGLLWEKWRSMQPQNVMAQ